MIKIKSKRAGFRRCGMPHPAETVEYPDDRFTPEQLAALQAEPMLIVEVVPAKKEETAPPPSEPLPAPAMEEKAAEIGKEPVKSGKKGKR
jgi:hypothetical protein